MATRKKKLSEAEIKAYELLNKKYRNKQHPLDYKNLYQLMMMVILSAQSTDQLVNDISPRFFEKYPDFRSLAKADIEELIPYISKIRSFRKKGEWMIGIAKEIRDEKNIPSTMKTLTSLAGIGRKSANVIMREAGNPPEGIMVDLHVIRVAQRLGITKNEDPKKIEEDMMAALPVEMWGDIGMSISFLGRDICRPSDPKHHECIMKDVCKYYEKVMRKKK